MVAEELKAFLDSAPALCSAEVPCVLSNSHTFMHPPLSPWELVQLVGWPLEKTSPVLMASAGSRGMCPRTLLDGALVVSMWLCRNLLPAVHGEG